VIHVAAFTTGREVPSSRFRIRQHIGPLAKLGLEVREHTAPLPLAMPLPGPLSRVRRRYLLPVTAGWTAVAAALRVADVLTSPPADVTWISRHFIPGLDGLARLTSAPRILDVDDAIWLEGWAGHSVPDLARRVDMVVAGNRFLAEWFGQWCPSVHVVPTAVDCARIRPPARPPPFPLVIGWTGTSSNYGHLEQIAAPLGAFFAAHRQARFLVCADGPPRAPALRQLPVDFVRWTPADEVQVLHRMHVGIMPLEDGDQARGKCGFKLLQYMAAGVPFVASPIGMNGELFAESENEAGLPASTPGGWREALEVLATNDGLRTRMGAAGRQLAEARFDVPIIAKALAGVVRALLGRRGIATGTGSS